jgi:hypothetical protein
MLHARVEVAESVPASAETGMVWLMTQAVWTPPGDIMVKAGRASLHPKSTSMTTACSDQVG